MKRWIGILICICFILGGCHKADPKDQIRLDVEETAYQIADKSGFGITYSADEGFLKKKYGFDVSQYSDYKALFGTMLDANRLILIESTDKAGRKAAVKIAENIRKELEDSFDEDQTELKVQAKDSRIIQEGIYVLFLSGPNASQGEESFRALFAQAGKN